MLQCAGDAIKAHPLFEKYCPNHGLKEEINAFLRRWWERYKTRNDGECFLYDPPRPGRPKNLTTADVQLAAHMFLKGRRSHGEKKHWDSVEQVSCALPRQRHISTTSAAMEPCRHPTARSSADCTWPPCCRHVRCAKKSET